MPLASCTRLPFFAERVRVAAPGFRVGCPLSFPAEPWDVYESPVLRCSPACFSGIGNGKRGGAGQGQGLRGRHVRDRPEHRRPRRRVPALVRALLEGRDADHRARRAEPVYCNADGVCGSVLGMGKVNSSSSMQAILLNPQLRFLAGLLRDLGRGRHAAVARHHRRGELGNLAGGLRPGPPLGAGGEQARRADLHAAQGLRGRTACSSSIPTSSPGPCSFRRTRR